MKIISNCRSAASNKTVFAVAVFLSLVSCVKSFSPMTNNLDVSMTKQDVIKVMGHNDEKRLIQGDEVLVYYMHNSVFDLFFTKSFPFVGFYPFNRTGKEFWIVLKDGKVASFGYPADFGKKIR